MGEEVPVDQDVRLDVGPRYTSEQELKQELRLHLRIETGLIVLCGATVGALLWSLRSRQGR
jgi:hypothetical protein